MKKKYKEYVPELLDSLIFECGFDRGDTLKITDAGIEGFLFLTTTEADMESSIYLTREEAGNLAIFLKHFAETGRFEAFDDE